MPVEYASSLGPVEFAELLRLQSVPTVSDLAYALLHRISLVRELTASGLSFHHSPFIPYISDRKSAPRTSSGRLLGRSSFVHSFSKSKAIPRSLPISHRGPIPGLHTSASGFSDHRHKTGKVNLSDTGRMLSQLGISINGATYFSTPPESYIPATEGDFGVFGDRSEIARIHNTGEGRVVQREFLGNTAQDITQIEEDTFSRVVARLNLLYL